MLVKFLSMLSIAIGLLEEAKPDSKDIARRVIKSLLYSIIECLSTFTDPADSSDLVALDLLLVRILRCGEPSYTLPFVLAEQEDLKRSRRVIKALIESGDYCQVAIVLPKHLLAITVAIRRTDLSEEEIARLKEEIEQSYELQPPKRTRRMRGEPIVPPGTSLNKLLN